MFKRALDIIGACIGLAIFGLPMIIIAILIKLDSNGPVFFLQGRLGKGGHIFTMYKFRSMIEDAEHMGTGLFSYENDNRITRVGHFIRKASLDELPQFINILNGSMSLVGPRPPVTYELGDYKDFSDHMKIRFKVKPGVTGLAQISGRNDLNWDKKIEYDNRYVDIFDRWDILLDLKILLQTIWVVLARKNTIEQEAEK